ncbi:hypothetical protein [Alkalispirochaeta sphaeroplastigenens]|nr:hypothetical protein [Alkalispirochaeta sphaeroplastigenens]
MARIIMAITLFCLVPGLQAEVVSTRYMAGILSFHQEDYSDISTYAFGGALGTGRSFPHRTWAGWRAEAGYRQHSSLKATEGNWIHSLHGSIGLEAAFQLPRIHHTLRSHIAAGNVLHLIPDPLDTEDTRLNDEWYLDRFLEIGLELSLRVDESLRFSSVFIAPRLWIFVQGGYALPVLVGLRR